MSTEKRVYPPVRRKRRKRSPLIPILIVILLALLLTVLLLRSCGSQEAAVPETQPVTQAEPEVTTVPPTEEPTETVRLSREHPSKLCSGR